jgi:two-component system phosphate regulon response regulator PhoB
MAKQKILVVEDEEDILHLLFYNLTKEGFEVTTAESGREALEKVSMFKPDLILLDLMLPEISGLDICKRIKQNRETASIPVVMVTAKGGEADIVSGLEIGADDYVTKPFSPKVLIARVRTVLRRKQREERGNEDAVQRGKLTIFPKRYQVLLDGEAMSLTPMEYQFLITLAQKPGWVFTRNQIVTAIRGENYAVTDRAVDVLVVGLRKKLGDYQNYIETVRGVGYRFSSEPETP